MIPDEDRFDMSLRDYFLLDYSDLISSHPRHTSTWTLVADYLHSAGDEGRKRLKEFIIHVGIDNGAQSSGKEANGNVNVDDAMEVEEDPIDAKYRHFANIREICITYRLEEEWSVISRIMADRLVRYGEFGIAATMLVQVEDNYGLSRLSEKIVDTYIAQGKFDDNHRRSLC